MTAGIAETTFYTSRMMYLFTFIFLYFIVIMFIYAVYHRIFKKKTASSERDEQDFQSWKEAVEHAQKELPEFIKLFQTLGGEGEKKFHILVKTHSEDDSGHWAVFKGYYQGKYRASLLKHTPGGKERRVEVEKNGVLDWRILHSDTGEMQGYFTQPFSHGRKAANHAT